MEWFFTGKEKVHQFANVGKTSGGHTVRFTNEIAAITRLHEACSKPDKHIQYSFPIVFPNKWQRTTSYGWLTVWLCITATSCGCKLCLFIAHVRKQACFCQIKMDIFLSSYRRAKLKNNFENISKWLELEWILSVSVTCLPHSFGIIGFSFTVIFFLFIVLPISGTESYFVRCKKTFEGIQHVRIFFLFFRGIVSSTLYNETKPNSFICGLA